jgi:Domain of unknown function (DUF6597)
LTRGTPLDHARVDVESSHPPGLEILPPYVEHLWVVRGYLPARWRNIILPDGAMELIVNLGDPQKPSSSSF